MITKGIPLKDAATQIAAKYAGTSIQSVQVDWQRRKKWMKDVVNVADSTFFEQAFFGLKELIPMAWLEFSRAPAGTAVKNRALAMLVEVYCRLISIMQDAGYAPKAPLEIKTVGPPDEEVWSRLTDEEKRQLIAASEAYARARSKANRNSTVHEGPLN